MTCCNSITMVKPVYGTLEVDQRVSWMRIRCGDAVNSMKRCYSYAFYLLFLVYRLVVSFVRPAFIHVEYVFQISSSKFLSEIMHRIHI